MPGKGHSGRFRSSISNRSDKPAFRVLAPWNSRKNGQKGQVAISQGTDTVKFQNLEAQQMANYNAGNNTFNMNNNFTVAGATTVTGQTLLNNNVNVSGNIQQNNTSTTSVGTLIVNNDATYNNNLTVGGNFTVNGTTTTLNTRVIDVSDSIIKVNDVFCDQSGNKSHGILFEYNSTPSLGLGGATVGKGFFGVKRKIKNSLINLVDYTPQDQNNFDGGPGVFTYYESNIDDTVSGALLTDGSFNIQPGLLGDALFKNLDLCGNLIGHGFGNKPFEIKSWPNGNIGTIWMRARDLSMNAAHDISMNAAHDISMCALNNMYLKVTDEFDVSANAVDIDAGTNVTMNSVGTTAITGGTGTTVTATTNNLALAATAAAVDIDAGTNVTMDSVGTTAITGGTGTTVTATTNNLALAATAAAVDIDAGTNVTMNSVGTTAITGGTGTTVTATTNNLALAATAANVDIDAGTNVTMDSIGTTAITGGTGTTVTATANNLTLAATAANVDIDAGTNVTMDSVGTTAITGGTGTTATATTGALTLAATAANVDIDAGTNVTMDSVGTTAITGGTGTTVTATANNLTLTGAADVDIDAGTNVTMDSVGTTAITGGTGTTVTATTNNLALAATAAAVDIDAGTNVTMNSVGTTAITGGTGTTVTATTNNLALAATAAAVDIDAGTNVTMDSVGTTAITGGTGTTATATTGALTLAATAANVDIDAGTNVTIDASDKITITSAANAVDAIKVEATNGGIDILASNAASGKDIDIIATGSSVNIKSTEADIKAITICAENGKVQIDGDDGVNIGTGGSGCPTSGSVTIQAGAGNSIVLNSDISANGDINAAGQTATFGTVVTDQLNLLNNFTIGTIGSNTNNFILFGAGGVIGNGVMNTDNTIPTTTNLNSVNIRESVTWISNDGAGTYQKTLANEGASLKGGSLIVDGNMLFGAARGRIGAYDQGPTVNVTYPGDGNQRRLLDMNCNDMSGIRILSFGKTPIGNWTSDGTNDYTDTWPGLSGCNYGLIDLACGVMVDISGLYFCDGPFFSSITAGDSLDVSSNAIHFFNEDGDNNILIDISGNLQVGGNEVGVDPVLKVMYTQQNWNTPKGNSTGANGSTAHIKTTNTAPDAIALTSTAGGVDVDAGTTVTIDSTTTTAITGGTGTTATATTGALTLEATAANVDIDAGTNVTMNSVGTTAITGGTGTTVTATTNNLALAATAAAVDIDAGTNVTMDSVGTTAITGGTGTTVTATTNNLALAATAAAVDIDAGTNVTMNSVGTTAITGGTGTTVTATTNNLALAATAANVDIDAGTNVTMDSIGTTAITGGTGTTVTATTNNLALAATAAAVDIDAGTTVTIDSTTTTAITGGTGTTVTATTNNLALAATAAAVDIDAGTGVTINAGNASNFTTSAGALTLDGAAGVNIQGNTSEVDISTSGTVDINGGTIDLKTGTGGFYIDATGVTTAAQHTTLLAAGSTGLKVGQKSLVMGSGNTINYVALPNGGSSLCVGDNCTFEDDHCIVGGSGSTCTGRFSLAHGQACKSLGSFSNVALGYAAYAGGNYCVALGYAGAANAQGGTPTPNLPGYTRQSDIGSANVYANVGFSYMNATTSNVSSYGFRLVTDYTTTGTYLECLRHNNNATGGGTSNHHDGTETYTRIGSIMGSNTSDSRSKENIIDVNTTEALEKLKNIKPIYFNYKTCFNTPYHGKQIGFLGEDVKKHFSLGTKLIKECVKNECRLCTDITWTKIEDDKFKLTINDLTELSPIDEYKINVELDNGEKVTKEVKSLIDDKKSFILDKEYKSVYLIGMYVDDFITLNTDAIFKLYHAGIQELDKQLTAEKAKTAALESKLKDIEARLSAGGL